MKIGIESPLGLALAVWVGLSAGPSALAAASDPAPAGAPDSITVPFAPTLGKPLHLHVVVSETRFRNKVEQPATVTTSDEDMVFSERNTVGYVLRWTTRSATVRTSPEWQALLETAAAAGVGKPVVIQTNSHGVPVAVLNRSELRALLVSTFEAVEASFDTQFAARPQADREAMRKALTGVVTTYRNMTDDQLRAFFLKEPLTVLGLGGTTLTIGRPVSFHGTFALPLINANVVGTKTVELRDAGIAEIRIRISKSYDPKETKAAVESYFKRLFAEIAPDKRDDLKAAFDKLPDMTIANELLATLDAKSGLPRQVTYRTGVIWVLSRKHALRPILLSIEGSVSANAPGGNELPLGSVDEVPHSYLNMTT